MRTQYYVTSMVQEADLDPIARRLQFGGRIQKEGAVLASSLLLASGG